MNVVMLALALTTTVELSHTQARRSTSLPARFEHFLAGAVKPTAAERKLLLDGAPVTKLLDGDPSKEIAVFGAVWIDAPRERYAAAVKDIERFESGGAFRITRKISVPPTLADFAELRLPEEDVADLGDCEVGDCELKLGKASIDAIRSRVHFSQPGAKSAVEAVFRERAHEYVTAYREKGNAGLAVYRDASRPTFVANELKSMIDRMPTAMGLLPELRTYLLQYPNATLPNSTDFLYLAGGAVRTEADHSHQPSRDPGERERNDRGVEDAVRKPLLLDGARGASPGGGSVRGSGFWFITVNRSRSDGLSGFIGRILRGRVRNEVQQGTVAALKLTKASMEGSR